MNLYADTSALVKRYIEEPGTEHVYTWIAQARVVGTAAITQVEVPAALAKAVRIGTITPEVALSAWSAFRSQWAMYYRLQVGETLLDRAEAIAWEQGLRGYYSVHLAASILWQEVLKETVVLLTYDRELWRGARAIGQAVLPEQLR